MTCMTCGNGTIVRHLRRGKDVLLQFTSLPRSSDNSAYHLALITSTVSDCLHEDCSDAIISTLDTNSLLALGLTCRAASISIQPFLVKDAVVVGKAPKVAAFCSFILSKRLAGRIRGLSITYVAFQREGNFRSETASVAVLLAEVLEEAHGLQTFGLGEVAISIFNCQPRLLDILQNIPSLKSFSIWQDSPEDFEALPCIRGLHSLVAGIWWYKTLPAQYSTLSRFISASAETLTQLELYDSVPAVDPAEVNAYLPLMSSGDTIFPQLRSLRLNGVVPAVTATELVRAFPNIESLFMSRSRLDHETDDFFSHLDSTMDTWPHLTTIMVPTQTALILARRYQHTLRNITVEPDVFDTMADFDQLLDAIRGCSVKKLCFRSSCDDIVEEGLRSNGDESESDDEGPSEITASWVFANVAKAVPHLRILAPIIMIFYGTDELAYIEELANADTIQQALAALTHLECLSLTIRASTVTDETGFEGEFERVARSLFRASSALYLQITVIWDFHGMRLDWYWRRTSGSSEPNTGNMPMSKISQDEYDDAEKRILQEK
ncbi:hypothetical protein DENSPDRAFT_852474 [Dentipellis sp. KUC8613]|nr:hypothetical protein DENSPDRAFT_852474 [Dentipellis sp. KUC8613]